MIQRTARATLAAVAAVMTLAACSFISPFAGERATEKLDVPPPPAGIGDDLGAAPTAPVRSPPEAVPPPAQPAPTSQGVPPLAEAAGPILEWHTVLDADAVRVEFIDGTSHYRVERVTLLGPAGAAIASGPLVREVQRSYGYSRGDYPPGAVGVDVFGGSSTGVGVSLGTAASRGGPSYTGAPKTRTRTRIVLPDPTAYRTDAKAWKIAVELIDSAGETSLVELPAPSP